MKTLITLFLCLMISFQSFAACEWSSIEEKEGKYTYSKECHLEVGRMVKAEKKQQEQVAKLKESLDLKDLALEKADQRVMTWRQESYQQHEYLERQIRASKRDDLLYFGGGIVLTVLSVWAAGQLKN